MNRVRSYRIEDAPGYVSPKDLRPVVPVTDSGAEAICPRCQTVNRVGFGGPEGRLEWWPDLAKGHCAHFRGFYDAGEIGSVEAAFA